MRLDEEDDILIPGRVSNGVEPRQGMRAHAIASPLSDETGEVLWELEDGTAQST